jgi:SP family sugar:H+ symporter-like MFS transporter
MGFSKEMVQIPLTLLNTAVNVVSTFPGMYLIERWGRKKLLVFGAVGMAISLYASCLFTELAQQRILSGWFGAISVYLFIVSFSSTWGPVVWVYQSEIFPQRVRAKATGMATLSNWVWNAVVAKSNPYIQNAINAKVYLIYGTMCVIMGIYSYAFVPETMGKTLEEMDDLFGGDAKDQQEREKFSVS